MIYAIQILAEGDPVYEALEPRYIRNTDYRFFETDTTEFSGYPELTTHPPMVKCFYEKDVEDMAKYVEARMRLVYERERRGIPPVVTKPRVWVARPVGWREVCENYDMYRIKAELGLISAPF